MHNNEFEKRVEHKLEELKFTPSDAVWQKVEVQIRERKQRRRFFFWWLPAIVLCTGIGGWFIYSAGAGKEQIAATAIEKKQITSSSVKNGSETEMNPVDQKKAEIAEKKNRSIQKNTNQKEQLPAVTTKVKTKLQAHNNQLVIKEKSNVKKQTDQLISKTEKPEVPVITAPIIVSDRPVAVNIPIIEKKNDTISTGLKQEKQTETKKPNVTDSSAVTAVQLPVPAKKDSSSVKKKKVEVAAVFRTGIAGMSHFSAGFNAADRLYASPANSGGGTPAPKDSSSTNIGTGFSIGLQLKKPVSKRSALSIGFAYAYYTSSNKTGATVNSAAQFNNSVTTSIVNSYARVGDNATYTNRYHFIEIPLLYHLQVNKAAKRPISFNGGFAYSYLISSNAQYYSISTGAYYYDRQLFSFSQLQMRAGLSIGLVKKLNYPLQLGVQYQYGLSGQWKRSLDLNQHLSFTGIQLAWRLNKK